MAQQKFTVMLIPDGDGYQVIVPHYSECTTWGKTPQEALDNAKEAMEMILEHYAEECNQGPVPYNVHASHVVIGEIEAEVPDTLMSELIEAQAKSSADVSA